MLECIIEVPRGSRNKYELDKKSGLLRLDRVLYSAVFYPANYGFIPRTFCDDSDPLDILVLGQEPVVPLCIVTARPIGVMQMVDENEEDDKIIAIHENDPAFTHYRDISHLPEHALNELQRFFEDYKALEHKKVRIERFLGRIDAHNVITRSMRLYEETFEAGEPKEDDETGQRYVSPTLRGADESAVAEANGSQPRLPETRSPSIAVRLDAARRAAGYLAEQETNRLTAGEDANGLAESHTPAASFPHHDLDEVRENDGAGKVSDSQQVESITIDDSTYNALTLHSHAGNSAAE